MSALGDGRDESGADPNSARARLLSLLEYIEHVEKLNRKPQFEVPTDYFCGYEGDLRETPGLEFNLIEDDLWLRVPRRMPESPPAPSAALKPWVILTDSIDKEPTLRDEIPWLDRGVDGAPGRLKRTELPDIDKLFSHYLSTKWRPWREKERPNRQAIAFYKKLFAVYQALEAEGSENPLELVWGIGVAVWRPQNGPTVRYPLITQLVEVTLDTMTYALEVRPRERLPSLESDCYAALEVPGVANLEATWRKLMDSDDVQISPFDPTGLAAVLKPAVSWLDSTGVYVPENPARRLSRALPAPARRLR
jgi:hypothetical protein